MKNTFHRIVRKLYNKTLLLGILIQGVFVPLSVFAQSYPPNPGSSSGGGQGFGFKNPLGADSLGGFINLLLGLLVQLAIPVIALFIIWAGFLFVTARGNEEQLKRAKKTLLNTIIGAAVILGAQVISGIITGTLLSL